MRIGLLPLMVLLFSVHPAGAAQHSALWGKAGENWSARSRLPDFSFAGYRRGDQPLPMPLAGGRSVKDFGARGDGLADDTDAFIEALKHVDRGTIAIPPGRYKITQILELTRPNVVFRGAGPDKTVLFFPTPLNDVKANWGATTSGQRTSNYSWSGGFLWFRGSFGSKPLAEIAREAKRGDTSLFLSRRERIRIGQTIEVFQSDTPDNSLAIHLYSGDSGPVHNLKGRTETSLVCSITGIEGDRIEIDRPLRCDLRLKWGPRIRSFEPTVTECGIENLAFEFPGSTYGGHFTERGYNAVAFNRVAHCWIRNIRILNADSGIFLNGHFNTVSGVVLESAREPDRQKCVGHHGISIAGGDNLVTKFDFRTRFIHDITVSHHCAGNVCSDGRAADLSLDHHRYAPYENLFTDIDAGQGTRLWKCGGGAALGKHCGARGTFWNIRAGQAQTYPPTDFGPASMNLVALQTETETPSETKQDGRWFEAISPSEVAPANLHAAQLERRLKQSGRGDTR